jgi:hypothetical protein
MLERIKIMLGITDNLQDDLLDVLVTNVTKHLQGMLKRVDPAIADVPDEIEYIIEEVVVRRYNRIGSEGMKSDSAEGHTVTFYDLKDEFIPYQYIIDGYKPVVEEVKKRGKVKFI